MFRKGGVSKQPTGILASSPELMTSAQKAMLSGNPIKAQTGASVNYMNQLNLVLGKNRQTPFGGYETVPASRVNLSPTGADYQSGRIDIFGKDRTRLGKTALEQLAQTESAFGRQVGPFDKKIPIDQLQVEGGDISKQNLGVVTSDDTTTINTSIKNILDKAQKAVETDVEAQRSEELSIIGEDEPGVRDFTEEVENKTEDKKQKVIKPDIGNKDYGLGVITKKKNDGSLSSNVTNDNTDINSGIVDLNKMIVKNTPGSSENIAANKKINNLISQSIKNNDINKATEANLIASGGATVESVKEMSQEDKDKALRERISNLYGKDIGLEGDLKAMNLVMLGLRIAAGESPNAITNIAKGAIQQMDEVGKQVAKEQERKDKIASLVVSETLRRENKETDFKNQKEIKKIDQKHDISLFKMQDAAAIKRDAAKMNFQVLMQDKSNLHSLGLKKIDYKMHGERLQQSMNMKIMDIETKEKITLANIQASADQLKFQQISKEQHAENMFKLNKELELEKTMLSNMPKGYVLGLMEGKKKGLKDKELIDFAAEQGSKFAKARVLTGSETLKGSLFGIVEAQVKDGISVEKALESTLNNSKFQELHKQELKQLGLYNEAPAQGGNTLSSLGLPNYEEGTALGSDGKPYTGTGNKFIVGPGGTIQKG
tara:strand:+ start:374 stop:2350 length:1977 start_codon:yes stop_codon:yes gene_type:complete